MNNLDDFKHRLKETMDCRDLFSRYGIELKRVNSHTAKCCCPAHKEKTPSCHVYDDHYWCYGCQTGGDLFDFVMMMETVEFMESVRRIAEYCGLDMPSMDPEAAKNAKTMRDRSTSIYDALKTTNVWYRECLETSEVGRAALRYCKARGITKPMRELYDVGYAPDDRVLIEQVLTAHHPLVHEAAGITGQSKNFTYLRLRDRLTFGLRDRRGRLCGFSGRRLVDEPPPAADGAETQKLPPKYLNTAQTEVFDKGRLFFGWLQAAASISRTRSVTICEGQTDVIALVKNKQMNAVAPLGTAFTEYHAQLITRHAETATFCFDADKAGAAATLKAIQLLIANQKGTAS